MTLRRLPARTRAWWRSRHEAGGLSPEVGVQVGPHLPGALLRAAFVVAVAVLLLAGGARTHLDPELLLVTAGILTVWAAWRPGPASAHVAVVVTALAMIGSAAGSFDPAVLWLAPLGYAVVRLGWWADHVRVRDRIELAALRRTLARDVVVVGVTLGFGAAAWAVADRQVPWSFALGVASLAALAWNAVRRDDGEAR